MEYHYEYSTYNSHQKVLINLQASNMDGLKSKSCMPFSQIVFTTWMVCCIAGDGVRQGTSYKYLMTGCVKGPSVSYVIFPVETNELRGPFVYCIFNEIISIICIIMR